MPPDLAGPFVRRLKIVRNLDQRLASLLRNRYAETARHRFRVKIRNSRFRQTEPNIVFLNRFFEKFAVQELVSSDVLDFTLGLLEDHTSDTDMYSFLMQQKRLYVNACRKAGLLRADRVKNNMETLIMRGIRLPHLNGGQLMSKIVQIDKICLTVFGRTEDMGLRPSDLIWGGSWAGKRHNRP